VLKNWVDTTLCDKICQRLATGTPVSSTNKTDRHDIAEILLKVALNSINQTNPVYFLLIAFFPSNFGKIIDFSACSLKQQSMYDTSLHLDTLS
jgi:hypothetical protein